MGRDTGDASEDAIVRIRKAIYSQIQFYLISTHVLTHLAYVHVNFGEINNAASECDGCR